MSQKHRTQSQRSSDDEEVSSYRTEDSATVYTRDFSRNEAPRFHPKEPPSVLLPVSTSAECSRGTGAGPAAASCFCLRPLRRVHHVGIVTGRSLQVTARCDKELLAFYLLPPVHSPPLPSLPTSQDLTSPCFSGQAAFVLFESFPRTETCSDTSTTLICLTYLRGMFPFLQTSSSRKSGSPAVCSPCER